MNDDERLNISDYEGTDAVQVIYEYLERQENMYKEALVTAKDTDIYVKQGCIQAIKKIKSDILRKTTNAIRARSGVKVFAQPPY